ncbi:VRR-NUC domain-containing protein [Halocella sp. SP3-1]|uniref:VRR-NUC domain-containing protein n=1 Tax=Halocella sp. SP3-1 TaxID=2382161 RepID=UPI000F7597D3|nr:VRR-NUC domain-containing protein [Halocella sp. SP3-1]AZO95259.1 VRR-NUC domain-containing protein [Halocella sp. SP3-1]
MSRGLNWTSLPKKYRKKSGSKKVYCPLEEVEQEKLAEYLDWNNYTWFHVPNEGKFKVQYLAKRARLGVKKGVPDNFICEPVRDKNGMPLYCGIVIELKRKEGGQTTPEQKAWLKTLEEKGWLTKVCRGADEAIDFLEEIFEEG